MLFIAIALLFPATALGAGQPLIEVNEESPDTAEFLSPKRLYTGAAVTEGAISELIAHEASSQHELAKERTLVSELSNRAKQLRRRLAGSQKSEQLSRKMADLSKAEAEVVRSGCHQKMEEMQWHFRNRTRLLKRRLHNRTSEAAFVLNRTVESAKHELQMERDRAFRAQGRVLVLEEELRRTATALEYTKRKEKNTPLAPEQLDGKRKTDAGLKAVLAGLRMQLGNKSVEEPAWSTFVNQLSAVFAAEQKQEKPKEQGMSEVMSEGGATKLVKEHTEETDKLEEEVENLRAQLRKSQQDTLAARTELQGTKDQLVSVQLDLQSTRDQIESMPNHRDTASDIMVLENVSGKALAAERAELSIAKAELARERRNFRAAEKDLNNAHNELAAENLTRSQLQHQLSAERSAHCDDKLLRKTQAALHMAIADLNRTRSELDAVRANLVARDANMGAMHAELQRSRGKTAATDKILASDNRQIQRLRKQVLTEGHELNTTQKVLSRTLQELEGVNKSLTAERQELSIMKVSLANATRGLNKTRVDLQGLRVKMAARDNQLEAKDKQLRIMQTKERQEENVLNSTHAELNTTEALLGAKLQNLQAYSNSLVVKMHELDSVHTKLRTVTDALDAAHADVAAKDLKLNMTSKMLHSLRSSLENKTRLQAAMQEELLGSRSKLNATQHMVQVKAEALKVANQLLIAKSGQLEQEHASLANATVALQHLRTMLDYDNQTSRAREQDVRSLNDRLRVAQAAKTQLEEDWKASGAQNLNLSLELQGKIGELLATQTQLEMAKSKFWSLRNTSARQESELQDRLSAAAADVQSLTMQHKMQEAARRDLLEQLGSKGKELNSTRATLAAVQSRLAAMVTQLGVLQQVHIESEERERNFREVMQHKLTTALGSKDQELSKIHTEMGTIEGKMQGVATALRESELARQFLLTEQSRIKVTLDARNSELDNLRAELAKATHRMKEADAKEQKREGVLEENVLEVGSLRKALAAESSKEMATAEEEHWTNATLEAKVAEVSRLSAALAIANDKALEMEEKIIALRRERSEMKVHDFNVQRDFDFEKANEAKLNKKLAFDNSDELQGATLAMDLMHVIDRLRVELHQTRKRGMEADAQQARRKLDVAHAALKDSMERHAHLASSVESTLAAVTSALEVRDVQLRADRSLLEDALAHAHALQAEVRGLTKALKVEDHALKATHKMLHTARADVIDLVAAHRARQPESAKKLQAEVKKMHSVIQHDENLIHQYQRRERRLRAQLRFAE